MVDFRKYENERNIIVVHSGQDIAVTRYRDDSCPDESPCSNFLLIEIYDSDYRTLRGELIDYISNLVKEKEKSDEKCAEYRKLYLDLLTKTTAMMLKND